jgi:hypothetical protein
MDRAQRNLLKEYDTPSNKLFEFEAPLQLMLSFYDGLIA